MVLLLAATPLFAESIYVVPEPCRDEAPETPYGIPVCADYELHSALIAAAETGDASAIELLRKRYDLVDTHSERHRIAAALLRYAPDDTAIWSDILAEAELAVRFADVDGDVATEFEEWCAARGFESYEHDGVLHDALAVAATDPRALPLLTKGLDTQNSSIAYVVVAGLAAQRNVDSLPAIDKLIERFPDDARWLAMMLNTFEPEQADAIALKYLDDEDDIQSYHERR
jgi:hypothetical protein